MKCESKNYGAQIKVSRYKCSSSVNYARKHMSVITVKKDRVEIESHLRERGDLKVVIIGCDKCAKTSNTGGTEQVREMKKQLRDRGFMLRDVEGLVDAVEEGLCDPKAVPERLAPLKSHDSYQCWYWPAVQDFSAPAIRCPACASRNWTNSRRSESNRRLRSSIRRVSRNRSVVSGSYLLTSNPD